MNCINCGNFMNDGDRFCMKCGTPVQAAANTPAPGPQPQVQAQPVLLILHDDLRGTVLLFFSSNPSR